MKCNMTYVLAQSLPCSSRLSDIAAQELRRSHERYVARCDEVKSEHDEEAWDRHIQERDAILDRVAAEEAAE